MTHTGGQRGRRQNGTSRWETIRYALDSTPRTVRLCMIMLVASIPPGALMAFLSRKLGTVSSSPAGVGWGGGDQKILGLSSRPGPFPATYRMSRVNRNASGWAGGHGER